ncbi:PadR family transcriptional regulator [Pseudoalteromonas aurantia]|uniref:Transcription regulator PadR N-terminal domain-containing protein n=1 Tax=Pseudoalteromonas aurantia 208 TaxID=1314867 RepID=A0ABR9EBZ3_9GAMM|nr:PadR family transcriptional regulator [Pseudoalteromonas aurantia]MBE0368347.1 hypothetical protein [Pseudoalteromonas aurantia 208]
MANKKSYLGEFEHLVLLSILHLGDEAYGVTVRRYLKDSIDREVSIGAIYTTVERFEKKGFITSKKGGATAERGGKAKRYFTVTALGVSSLQDTRIRLEKMWCKLPVIAGLGD